MPPKKFYGIHRGAARGVYSEWKTVETLTRGIPGSKFRSFPDQLSAEFFAEHGHAPAPHDLKLFATKQRGVHCPLMEHKVVRAVPNEHCVKFFNKIYGSKLELCDTKPYDPSSMKPHEAEIKGVAEQLLVFADRVVDSETKNITIEVCTVQAHNALNKYFEGWRASQWRDCRGRLLKMQPELALLASLKEDERLSHVDLRFGFCPPQ